MEGDGKRNVRGRKWMNFPVHEILNTVAYTNACSGLKVPVMVAFVHHNRQLWGCNCVVVRKTDFRACHTALYMLCDILYK